MMWLKRAVSLAVSAGGWPVAGHAPAVASASAVPRSNPTREVRAIDGPLPEAVVYRHLQGRGVFYKTPRVTESNRADRPVSVARQGEQIKQQRDLRCNAVFLLVRDCDGRQHQR